MDNEAKTAGVLTVASFVVFAVMGMVEAGIVGGYLLPVVMLVVVGVQVVLGIVACLIVAKVMGASFGLLTAAIVKLAGILSTSYAVLYLLPSGLGLLLSLVVYFALLMILFELEWPEVVAFALTLWLLRLALGGLLMRIMTATLMDGGTVE